MVLTVILMSSTMALATPANDENSSEPHRTRVTPLSRSVAFGAKCVAVLAEVFACNDAFCTWLDATEAPRLRPGSETSALPVPGLSLSRATNKPRTTGPFLRDCRIETGRSEFHRVAA